MKRQIFFIVGSLGAGGSERVYWLLSQYFNDRGYQVSVVFLNARDTCFSTVIPGINFIDLKTIKASRSFFKLYHLIKRERPLAVFSTTDHLNILTGLVASFLSVPKLIARASNDPKAMRAFYGMKARFYNLFTRFVYYKFDTIVCQTEEMAASIFSTYGSDRKKMAVISNPLLPTKLVKFKTGFKHNCSLVTVGRLVKEKGLFRLLQTMLYLPETFTLTIIGTGQLMPSLQNFVSANNLKSRIYFKGHCTDVVRELLNYDLMVMTSYTEGFPNVILESISVGLPVVSFDVSGANKLIKDAFNGFIVPQGDLATLKKKIKEAHSMVWEHDKIKADAIERFNLSDIGSAYEKLLHLN